MTYRSLSIILIYSGNGCDSLIATYNPTAIFDHCTSTRLIESEKDLEQDADLIKEYRDLIALRLHI